MKSLIVLLLLCGIASAGNTYTIRPSKKYSRLERQLYLLILKQRRDYRDLSRSLDRKAKPPKAKPKAKQHEVPFFPIYESPTHEWVINPYVKDNPYAR